jgi:hypothetical protein
MYLKIGTPMTLSDFRTAHPKRGRERSFSTKVRNAGLRYLAVISIGLAATLGYMWFSTRSWLQPFDGRQLLNLLQVFVTVAACISVMWSVRIIQAAKQNSREEKVLQDQTPLSRLIETVAKNTGMSEFEVRTALVQTLTSTNPSDALVMRLNIKGSSTQRKESHSALEQARDGEAASERRSEASWLQMNQGAASATFSGSVS